MTVIMHYMIGILLPLGAGFLSTLLAGDMSSVYGSLQKPPGAPPAVLFPIAWSILYVLMGIASVWVWKSRHREQDDALVLYTVQLLVNVVWPVLFFRLQWRLPAFFWLLLLFVLAADMVVKFVRIDPKAGYINVPYLGWLLFAGYLNLASYFLNR